MIRTIISSSNSSGTWRFLCMRGTLQEPLFTAANLSAWRNVNVLQERYAHTCGNGNEVKEKEARQSHSEGSEGKDNLQSGNAWNSEGSEGKDNLQSEGNAQKKVENTSNDFQIIPRRRGPIQMFRIWYQAMLRRVKGPKRPGPDKGPGARHYK